MARPTGLLTVALLLAAGPAQALDTRRVVEALVRISATRVPHKRVHCEVSGPTITQPDDSVVYRKVTVGDFLSSYVSWAMVYGKAHRQSFKCSGKGVVICTWEYGERANARNPGWQTFLRFRFDERSGRVKPASLECYQVP
jgi:hypothetical protein